MANSYVTLPVFLDTDMTTSWRNQSAVQTQNINQGVQVTNLILNAPSAATPGAVTVTDGATSPTTLLLLDVLTTTVFPVVMTFTTPLQWRDFKVTGLTATGTNLQIWTRQ